MIRMTSVYQAQYTEPCLMSPSIHSTSSLQWYLPG